MGLAMASRRKFTVVREPNGVRSRRPGWRALFDRVDAMNGKPAASLYVMEAGSAVKIGLSKRPGSRALGVQTGQEKDVRVHWAIRLPLDAARQIEREIHNSLRGSKYHARGEWYYMSPAAARGLIEAEIGKSGVKYEPDLSFGFDRE